MPVKTFPAQNVQYIQYGKLGIFTPTWGFLSQTLEILEIESGSTACFEFQLDYIILNVAQHR